jgi:hypothetical protein
VPELERVLRRLAAAQSGVCTWCLLPLGDDLGELAIDHIIPISAGGPDAEWNRQALHNAWVGLRRRPAPGATRSPGRGRSLSSCRDRRAGLPY